MTPTKSYYRIREVSEMLKLPAHTLRYWEDEFPQLNPHRTESGQRRYTPADVDMVKRIQELLHVKGLKVEAAKELLNATYRKYPPRNPIKCESAEDAIRLLENVKDMLEDAHAVAKLDAVIKFCSCFANVSQNKK